MRSYRRVRYIARALALLFLISVFLDAALVRFASPWTRYIPQFIFVAWALALPFARLIEPDLGLEWARGYSLFGPGRKFFFGDGAWSEVTERNRTFVDWGAFSGFIIGSLLLLITLYEISNGCQPKVIC